MGRKIGIVYSMLLISSMLAVSAHSTPTLQEKSKHPAVTYAVSGGFDELKTPDMVMLNDATVPLVLENPTRHTMSVTVVAPGHTPEVMARARPPNSSKKKRWCH
jgi:hypothetical protein